MRRRRFIGVAGAALVSQGVLGQGPRGRAHVVLNGGFGPQRRAQWAAWFAEHGYVEGRNLDLTIVDIQEGRDDAAIEGQMREVLAIRPDVFVSPGAHGFAAMQRLTRDLPLVFFNLGADPVGFGYVHSLREPGGNITGTTQSLTAMIPKFWELLREFRPRMKRGGLFTTKEYVAAARHMPFIREAVAAASSQLGIEIIEVAVPEGAAFPAISSAIRESRVEGLLVVEGAWSWIGEFMDLVVRTAIPAIYASAQFVRKGGLISLSPDFREGERLAVGIVARILRGERPATIPVYQATRYEIAVNLRTARAMGLTVPPSVLLRADVVVE